MALGGKRHVLPGLTPGKWPILQEAGWAPGSVWTGAENLAPSWSDPWNGQPVASILSRSPLGTPEMLLDAEI